MSAEPDPHWVFPAWDGVEREHLRMARDIPLRKKLDWLEQAAEIATRLQKSRESQRLIMRERRESYSGGTPAEEID